MDTKADTGIVRPDNHFMRNSKLTPATFFASFFGVGFLPWAPGTWGSLTAALIYLALPSNLFWKSGWYIYGAGLFLLCGMGVWLSGLAEKKLGHDAHPIVIDEVCGYFLAVLLLPHTWQIALYGFILFRAIDIAKPWPANIAQRLHGGWGVVADDLAAGIYANVLIRIIQILAPRFFGL
jgi:phosphatidylglycerophosphatase A